MPRYALVLLLLLLSAFTRTSVGGLPANCATPTKKLKAMAKKLFDPTKAGEVFCPLRENPIEHLEKSFAHIAGQDSARVRTSATASASARPAIVPAFNVVPAFAENHPRCAGEKHQAGQGATSIPHCRAQRCWEVADCSRCCTRHDGEHERRHAAGPVVRGQVILRSIFRCCTAVSPLKSRLVAQCDQWALLCVT